MAGNGAETDDEAWGERAVKWYGQEGVTEAYCAGVGTAGGGVCSERCLRCERRLVRVWGWKRVGLAFGDSSIGTAYCCVVGGLGLVLVVLFALG